MSGPKAGRVPLTAQELEEMVQAYRITHEETVRRATERTWLKSCLEVLLACGIVPATALELGLDLLVMETRPALGPLIHARGDLDRLRAHIPPRPPDSVTAADRQHIEDLLQECHSYPHTDYLGPD